ncbi:MAG: hypothetical protein M0R06_12290 [Sphaerochaeta sp.]|nr:hypothetical protein [Sphaerochaeta sp.]
MDSMLAFANGEANRGNPLMVFDWNKAAQIIKERKPKYASAGLHSDWKYTGGEIFSNGEPNLDSYTYLASTWATPELELNGDDVIPCFITEDEVPEEWGENLAAIKWPASALEILKGS